MKRHVLEFLRDLLLAAILTAIVAGFLGLLGCQSQPKYDIKAIQQVPMVNHPQK